MNLWDEKLGKPKKRALISYLTAPFRIPISDDRQKQFSNIGIGRGIVRALNRCGYIVDLIEWTDRRFIPSHEYDLFLGHGAKNFRSLADSLEPGTKKIYFATGLHRASHNNAELERLEYLRRRKGIRLPPDRWITDNEEEAYAISDGIICLGNQRAAATYNEFPKVIAIPNGVSPDPRSPMGGTDSASSRHFLFFAGPGNVHKGLDLLLEVFADLPAIHLHVCQELERSFRKAYKKELTAFANIHTYGFIEFRGSEFYSLIKKCGYSLLPSCAEGSAGSVLECMLHGLVPLITPECTLDLHDPNIILREPTVEAIREQVIEVSRRSDEWRGDIASGGLELINRVHLPEHFVNRFQQAVESILGGS